MFGAQSSSGRHGKFSTHLRTVIIHPHVSYPFLAFFYFFPFHDSLHEFSLPTHPPHILLYLRTSNVIIIIIIIVIGSSLLLHDCQNDDCCCVIIIIRHHYYRETRTRQDSTSRTRPPKVHRYCGERGKRHNTVVTEKIICFG